MAPRRYEPLATDVTMGRFGYWIVTISVSPWQRMSIMIAAVGVSSEQAKQLALDMTDTALGREAT